MTRTAMIVRDLPDLASEPDGHVWEVLYDGEPACDEPWDFARYVCRLPDAHTGEHFWVPVGLVEQCGIRFI